MKFLKKDSYVKILTVLIISIIFSVILLNKIIFSQGHILFWDFTLPIYPDRFVDYHTKIWDSMSSMSGVESIGRLFVRLPFVLLAYMGIDVGIIEKLMFISLYIIGISSAYFFLRKVISLDHWPSIFLSMSYTIFVHFFHNLHQYSPVYVGMIFPLIFSFLYLGLDNKKISFIIISSILMVATIQMPFTFVVSNLLILSYIIYKLISLKNIYLIKYYIIFMIIQIGIDGFYLLLLFVNLPSPESITSHIVTIEEIINFSKVQSVLYPLIGFPINVFKFESWSYYSNTILHEMQFLISMIILVFLPLSTFITKKFKISGLEIFFIIILFTLWQVSLGSMGLLGDYYPYLVTKYSIFGFMRSPQKFYIFIPFVILGLLGTVFNQTKKTLPSVIFFAAMIFVSFPSIVSWNDNLEPVKIPNEFNDVQEIIGNDISSENGYFRTIWYPEYPTTDTTWVLDNQIESFEQRSSIIPIYSYFRSGYRQNFIFSNYMKNLFIDNRTELASYYFNQYAVKYVIFHDDIVYKANELKSQNETKDMLNNLLASNDFILKYHKGFMYIFENKNYKNVGYFRISPYSPTISEYFFVQDNNKYVEGDFFSLDDGFKDMWNIFMISKNNIMINRSNYINSLIYYRLINNGYYLSPGRDNFKNSNQIWSVKSGWEIAPRFNTYVRYYINKSFNKYQLDFGERIVATIGKNVSETYKIHINKNDKYVFVIRLFENNKGGKLKIQLDEKSYTINTTNENDIFVWKKLDGLYLNSGDHQISVKNINGFNAINILGLIPENEYIQTENDVIGILNDKKIIYTSEFVHTEKDDKNNKNGDVPFIQYTKAGQASWHIKVNLTTPSMLAFYESYNPQWTAKIDKIDGKSVESEIIRPIPLNSVINGFWINQTGNLDITIEYEPQRWFYIGSAISITTLIICIGYLIYDFRKKKVVKEEVIKVK